MLALQRPFTQDFRDEAVRSAGTNGRTRHTGYEVSQRIRKHIEEIFGWVKTTGGLRKTRHRDMEWVGWMFTLTVADNVARIPKLS